MTKLEQEIVYAVAECEFATKVNGEFCLESGNVAKAAAEVAKKYIEKVWKDRIVISMEPDDFKSDVARMEHWMKENGVM